MRRKNGVLFVLVLLFLGFVFGFFVLEYTSTKAQSNRVEISNVSSSSFTVTWSTKMASKGVVLVVPKEDILPFKLGLPWVDVYHDSRDVKRAELENVAASMERIDGRESLDIYADDFVTEVVDVKDGKYFLHHVEVKGLSDGSEYEVFVGDGLFFNKVGSITSPLVAKTFGIGDDVSAPIPAYGSVRDAGSLVGGSNDLGVVRDGIVYVELFDDISGAKSNLLSSALNGEGNWYMDISDARDSEGERFVEKYLFEVANIMARIVVDGGPLGRWEKVVSGRELSPAEVLVLDDGVNANVDGVLKRVTSLRDWFSNLFGDVKAQSSGGACLFGSYCGCVQKVDGVWASCACDAGELAKRKCTGQDSYETTMASATSGCSGGNYKEGDQNDDGTKTCKKGYWVDKTSEASPNKAPEGVSGSGQKSTSDGLAGQAGTASPQKPSVTSTAQPIITIMPNVKIRAKCLISPLADNWLYIEGNNVWKCREDGTMVLFEAHEQAGVLRESCEKGERNCIIDNKILFLGVSYNDKIGITTPIETIYAGQSCDKEQCYCSTFTFKVLAKGMFCPEVSACNSHNVGSSCLKSFQRGVCVAEDTTRTIGLGGSVKTTEYLCKADTSSGSLKNFANIKTYAQENTNYDEYILNPDGYITNIQEGKYIADIDGQQYLFVVLADNLENNDGKILLFKDNNNNGTYDEGKDTKISDISSTVKIKTLEKIYKYTLKEGFNFISFPFLSKYEDSRSAAGLLKRLNDVYDNTIYSISKYDGRWKIVGQNGDMYDNNDFQLIPGQGYVLKVKEDIEIAIPGYPVQLETTTDKSPITFSTGWNLIGLYGSNLKQYTAKTLIQDINQYTINDFTADNVSKWDTSAQKYEGYQMDNTGSYGFDYPLLQLSSYFVRIVQGSGNWQPEIQK